MKLYDECEAVCYIKSQLKDEDINRDDILDVIDSIFDYYDDNGDLNLDFDEDDDINDDDETAIIEFVNCALSDSRLSKDLISKIVKAELNYELSLL